MRGEVALMNHIKASALCYQASSTFEPRPIYDNRGLTGSRDSTITYKSIFSLRRRPLIDVSTWMCSVVIRMIMKTLQNIRASKDISLELA